MADKKPRRFRRRRSKQARKRFVTRVTAGTENALEIIRFGRLSPRQGAPFEVVHHDSTYRLRHYNAEGTSAAAPAVLMIPPLMLTAEIYDVEPELSAVLYLARHGIDVWVCDFGAPEREEGGMTRTLDDHVRAVADAVKRMRKAVGKDVHLAGYSQGGMFAYQVAAYLKSEGLASVITFGSPVDIHRNLPSVSTDLTARLIRVLRPVVIPGLKRIEGLPGVITSTGFKLLSLRKELGQMLEFLQKLHDRQALEKRENRRRFLAGEGFVAWPGPALLKFIDEFIVHNRMVAGGFVIAGRTVTLTDLTCPVLCFVGSRDDIARPAAVGGIRDAAPEAEVHEVGLPAGHFGLVVGSTSMRITWPTVAEWLRWRDGLAGKPAALDAEGDSADALDDDEVVEVEDAAFDEPLDFDLVNDVVIGTLGAAWKRLGQAVEDLGDTIDNLRYQVPRLSRLRNIDPDTRVSFALSLSEQARRIPDKTFFLWKGRAFAYTDADRRVNNVVRGLIRCGVKPGQQVGVLMEGRPSYLSMVTAINRLGAVAVLFSPELGADALTLALANVEVSYLVTDPDNAAAARGAYSGEVLVLGGGPSRELIDGVIDMEEIDPDKVQLPAGFRENPGRAEDVAMVMVSVLGGRVKSSRITNRRWAVSAYGAAAACTLTSADTVYCCMPLHHPAGLLVSVGAALVGGARLALATRFEAPVFWHEVRRYGATVAFYAGEMLRELVDAPGISLERNSPLRLFAGSGVRPDVWREVAERFGVGVLEFYASTEGNLVLANASGEKVGALGRPLPGSAEVALLAYDFDSGELLKDALDRHLTAEIDAPGLLIARVDPTQPLPKEERAGSSRLLKSVFEAGDIWYDTGDLLKRDADGDFWFVERLRDIVRTKERAVVTRPIEQTLYELGNVALCAVYGIKLPAESHELVAAALVLKPGAELDAQRLWELMLENHRSCARPRYVRVVEKLEMTDGYRPIKTLLRREGLGPSGRTLKYDAAAGAYVEQRAPEAEPYLR